jgi:hypothetical protein
MELLFEDLGQELESFMLDPSVSNEEDARVAFEAIITAVRPSIPPIRIENVGGVPIAFLGLRELGPVCDLGGG